MFAQGAGRGLHHAEYGGLGRRVVHLLRASEVGANGRDADNATSASLFHHLLGSGLNGPERATDVGVEVRI